MYIFFININHIKAGTAYPSPASGFTPGFWWGSCFKSFLFSMSSSCVSGYTSVYGWLIFDCPVFSNVYLTKYCCTWYE